MSEHSHCTVKTRVTSVAQLGNLCQLQQCDYYPRTATKLGVLLKFDPLKHFFFRPFRRPIWLHSCNYATKELLQGQMCETIDMRRTVKIEALHFKEVSQYLNVYSVTLPLQIALIDVELATPVSRDCLAPDLEYR